MSKQNTYKTTMGYKYRKHTINKSEEKRECSIERILFVNR